MSFVWVNPKNQVCLLLIICQIFFFLIQWKLISSFVRCLSYVAVRKKRVQNNLRISNCSKSIDYLLIIPPSQFCKFDWHYNSKDLVPLFSPSAVSEHSSRKILAHLYECDYFRILQSNDALIYSFKLGLYYN